MRKIIHALLLLLIVHTATAQLSFETTGDYGKLWDIKYDPQVPNKLYALTLVNHLMESVDNGATWKILYSFPDEKTSLSGLKVAPGGKALTFIVRNNPNLKTNGVSVFDLATKTISRHYTAPNWSDDPVIMSYSLYGENGHAIILHTSYKVGFGNLTKVFYSSTTGTTWKEIYFSDEYNTVHINNVAISPADSTKLFLARSLGAEGVNGGLFISSDAGDSYVQVLSGVPVDPIAFDPADPNKILIGTAISFGATTEALYRSVNGGTSFTEVSGITWNDQTLNNITTIAYDPVNNQNIWLLDENEIVKSSDGGVTWTSNAFGPDNTTYTYGTSISFDPANSEHLFINSDGWPQYSADGGATLTQVKNPFCVTLSVSFGNYTGDKHLYSATLAGYLDKNLSSGTHAAYEVQSPFIVNARVRVPIADSTKPGRVFIYTPGDGFFNTSQLWLSDDYGATHRSLPSDDFSNQLNCFKKDPNAVDVYYVAYSSFGSGSLYKLDFSDINNPQSTYIITPASDVISGILPVKGTTGTLFITQGNKVYLSTDDGANWTEKITGLETLGSSDVINDINFNPLVPDQFVLATSNGIYLSADKGENWLLKRSGFYAVKAVFSSVTNGHIIAANLTSELTATQLTYSIDGGNNWLNVRPLDLQYLQASGVDFHFLSAGIDVYFSTNDLGVVKYQLTGLGNPLPLHLISFNGIKKNNFASLAWKSDNEQNLAYYELENSNNGRSFDKLVNVAAYNTPGNHIYAYDDMTFKTKAAISGQVYYRLKMVDTDGRSSYSGIVKISDAGRNNLQISIYPNPVTNLLNLNFQSNLAGQYQVKITDAAGKEYLRGKYQVAAGSTTIGIAVDNFAKGMYILTTETITGEISQVKFLKK